MLAVTSCDQNDYCKFVAGKRLVMRDIPISCDNFIEAFRLGRRYKIAILQHGPASLMSGNHLMTEEMSAKWPGDAMVEEYLQVLADWFRSRSLPNCRAPNACSLLTPGKSSRNSSMVSPSSR